MEISTWFIAVFILSWLVGPLTQLLQLVAPKLHYRLGMMEANAIKPEFKWFLLDERGVAIADMTYLVAGAVFVWLALLGNPTSLIFGIYTCACYVFVSVLVISRWLLLTQHDLNPTPSKQLAGFVAYMLLYLAFGLYGLVYLWGLAQE